MRIVAVGRGGRHGFSFEPAALKASSAPVVAGRETKQESWQSLSFPIWAQAIVRLWRGPAKSERFFVAEGLVRRALRRGGSDRRVGSCGAITLVAPDRGLRSPVAIKGDGCGA